jgi:3-hydroxybutyryl-CoA dehydrogenase
MKKIVVVGLGAIGKSIAVAIAQKGHRVVVFTRRGKEGFNDLCSYIEKLVNSRKLQKPTSELLKTISRIDTLSKIPPDTELVIEAVGENLTEKQLLFKELDSLCVSSILSSNTSSLSITEISRLMSKPERMLGIHFFNPAQAIQLVEIIPGEKTSKETVKNASAILIDLGKTPLIVPDKPGFLVNRLLFLMINEAISVLGEGNLTAEEIDLGMRLGLNHPMGPLRLADHVGLDVCLSVLNNLHKRTRNRQYKPHPLLLSKVANNDLGRKTGRGFFNYPVLKKG